LQLNKISDFIKIKFAIREKYDLIKKNSRLVKAIAIPKKCENVELRNETQPTIYS
jgi:hypothetical protein